jgi:hypothetical protein
VNGPDHYLEAERLVHQAQDLPRVDASFRAGLAACAQVHATLALTAATIAAADAAESRVGPSWLEATAPRPEARR